MSSPTLQIPRDVIEPVIEAHVAKAVIDALGGREQLLERSIAFAMNVKVGDDGKPSNYQSARPWLTWAITESIQKAAKAAIEKHLATNAQALEKQIAAELSRKNSPLAKQLASGMVGALASEEVLKWRLTVACESK